MSKSTLAPFLLPAGYRRPGVAAVLREGYLIAEAGRFALASRREARQRRATPYPVRAPRQAAEPVLLVPGFLAGDATLTLLSRTLRSRGFRTYRSHIRANVSCTLEAAEQLEARLEAISRRRGSRVRVVGHSLGGMIARGLAARRPDLVSGIVTMGSPMLAPAAHHISLTAGVDVLVRLSRAGLAGVMSEDCVAGACARQSWEEGRVPMPAEVAFTSVYSRRDGIIDWRACLDPDAVAVEVQASHVGMAVDPRVADAVTSALRPGSVLARSVAAGGSVLEVDRGESA